MSSFGSFRTSPRADLDLAEIRDFIAQNNTTAANRLIGELFDLFELIAKNPQMGQLRAELRPNLRSISHGNYVIFFYPMQDGIEVAGIIHGARDIVAMFREGKF